MNIRTPRSLQKFLQSSLCRLQNDFKEIVSKVSLSNKSGDRNINSLDYSTNSIVRQIFNFSYQDGVAPFINQPTRVSRPIAICITQILMNSFMDSEIMSGVIKTDISDHFVIFCTINSNEKYHFNDVTTFKRDINKDTISSFKYLLKNVAWRDVWNNEMQVKLVIPLFLNLRIYMTLLSQKSKSR